MKNHFKCLLSLFLVVIMLVPMISATGLTVTAATYSGKCGANLTWSFNDTTGVLKIEGTGDMYDYSKEYYNGSYRTTAPWKAYISYIKSVVISDSVTSIGEWAFAGCDSLTSVTIPDSLISIGGYAFYNCFSLTSVTIPDSVTSIGDSTFWECTSLTSVYITDIAVWCGITFNGNYANPLRYAKNLYLNNELITDLVIPDSVTSIGDYAFSSYTSLTSVTIPDSVTSIGESAFYSCDSLTSVTIPDSVTSIGSSTFNGCDSLTSVTIPDSVTSIGSYAFFDCDSLTSVTIPDSVTSIGDSAFQYCDSLTSVTIPDSVTSIGSDAFAYCDTLTSVTIGNSVTSIGDYAFSTCNALTSVTIGNSVTSIGDHAFNYCTSLASVTIPDSVTSIGVSAFYNCTSLTSVTIGNSVTSISVGAFYNCSSLTSVTIGNSVTSIDGSAFNYCTSLTSVTIPDSVTSIGGGAFAYCRSLTSVSIPDSVTSIGSSAFADCTSLTSVTIPDSVTSIGDRAFHYYSNDSLDLTIKCYENSYAHTYAKNNGFKYEFMCRHSFTNYISNNNATCTEDGTKTAYCDFGCGATDIIPVEGTAFGHTWSEWIVSIEPTYTTEGEQIRFCYVCDTVENEAIPMLPDPNKPVISVDNFKVTITNADNIKDMRYALGEYTTTTEIRNAPGNVALDNGVVTDNTIDGSFVYDMPTAGYFSIWIRMKDGTNYILPLDVTKVTASVSTYGVKITVHDIFDIKDIYIAKGEYQTYREIKDNGYIVALSPAKIGNKRDYTYTVYEPGVHTVLVRYNDGRTALFHETLTVEEPEITVNGLQVTVSNIPDVKVIRTAYGVYNTPGDVKRAEGARNFSGKSVIKGAEEYMIQYRENGTVTVAVEYNNGYVKVFHCEINMKQASCTLSGRTVLLRKLDGFVMIRYAPSEYSTSAEIKRASGSKVIKPADLTGEYAIVSGLPKGTYTFCVQFDDVSYNYFKIVIE